MILHHGLSRPPWMQATFSMCQTATRTSSEHVVGLRLGVIHSSDSSAPGLLHKLKGWSTAWYGSNFSEHLGKTFDTVSQAHTS